MSISTLYKEKIEAKQSLINYPSVEEHLNKITINVNYLSIKQPLEVVNNPDRLLDELSEIYNTTKTDIILTYNGKNVTNNITTKLLKEIQDPKNYLNLIKGL
jgi:DNA polymerase elongation subunit (family B)